MCKYSRLYMYIRKISPFGEDKGINGGNRIRRIGKKPRGTGQYTYSTRVRLLPLFLVLVPEPHSRAESCPANTAGGRHDCYGVPEPSHSQCRVSPSSISEARLGVMWREELLCVVHFLSCFEAPLPTLATDNARRKLRLRRALRFLASQRLTAHCSV